MFYIFIIVLNFENLNYMPFFIIYDKLRPSRRIWISNFHIIKHKLIYFIKYLVVFLNLTVLYSTYNILTRDLLPNINKRNIFVYQCYLKPRIHWNRTEKKSVRTFSGKYSYCYCARPNIYSEPNIIIRHRKQSSITSALFCLF